MQSVYYESSIYKYPYLFRPIILASTFVFTSGTGFSVQFFTKLVLLLFIFKHLLSLFRNRPLSQDLNFSIISIFLALLSIAIFPGHANYKYWLFLSPVLINPSCFSSVTIPILLMLLVYAEIIFRFMII